MLSLLLVQHRMWLILCLYLPCNHEVSNYHQCLWDAIITLAEQQEIYTKEVETIMCIAPFSPGDVTPLMLSLLRELVARQWELISLVQYQVSLFLFIFIFLWANIILQTHLPQLATTFTSNITSLLVELVDKEKDISSKDNKDNKDNNKNKNKEKKGTREE